MDHKHIRPLSGSQGVHEICLVVLYVKGLVVDPVLWSYEPCNRLDCICIVKHAPNSEVCGRWSGVAESGYDASKKKYKENNRKEYGANDDEPGFGHDN